MRSNHGALFAQSVSNGTRVSSRRRSGITPGITQAPFEFPTQPNSSTQETIPPEPAHEPIQLPIARTTTPEGESVHGSNKGADFDDQLVKSLEEIIEDYWGENIESFHAIVDITRLIFNHSSSTRAEKEQAFDEYAATIDAIRHQRTQAVERGRHATGESTPERNSHLGIRDTNRSRCKSGNKRRRGSPPSTDSSM